MFFLLFSVIFLVMIMLLFRAARGPHLLDRLLSINVLGNITVTLFALFGAALGHHDFLDIALLYALFNFSSTIAVLRFFQNRKLPTPYLHLGDEPAD